MGSALLPLPSYTPTNSFSLTGHYVGIYHKLDYASDMIDVLDMEDETILTKVLSTVNCSHLLIIFHSETYFSLMKCFIYCLFII